MNAKTSSHEDSILLSQDEISEYLAAFGDKEVYLREAVLLLPVEKVFALLDINPALSGRQAGRSILNDCGLQAVDVEGGAGKGT